MSRDTGFIGAVWAFECKSVCIAGNTIFSVKFNHFGSGVLRTWISVS